MHAYTLPLRPSDGVCATLLAEQCVPADAGGVVGASDGVIKELGRPGGCDLIDHETT